MRYHYARPPHGLYWTAGVINGGVYILLMMLRYFVCRNSGDGPDAEHAGNDKHVCWWLYGFVPRQCYKRYYVPVADIYTLLFSLLLKKYT